MQRANQTPKEACGQGSIQISRFHTYPLWLPSNRPRMFPLAYRRERVVEAHREVADEQTAGVGDFEAG